MSVLSAGFERKKKKERIRQAINFTILVYIDARIFSRTSNKIRESDPSAHKTVVVFCQLVRFWCMHHRANSSRVNYTVSYQTRSFSREIRHAASDSLRHFLFSRARPCTCELALAIVSAISRVQRSRFSNRCSTLLRVTRLISESTSLSFCVSNEVRKCLTWDGRVKDKIGADSLARDDKLINTPFARDEKCVNYTVDHSMENYRVNLFRYTNRSSPFYRRFHSTFECSRVCVFIIQRCLPMTP